MKQFQQITTRIAKPDDIGGLCKILNEIIEVSGTTANQVQLTNEEFAAAYVQSNKQICCHVAVDKMGNLAGFQALKRHTDLPKDWADIATFSRLEPKLKGVGMALFEPTKQYAKHLGFKTINATIRADNTGGLAYYDKLGFETYTIDKDIPLEDGTKVDRISKQFLLKKS